MRATKEAGPVLDQYHSQLDRAAQGVEGKDPELLQTLRDLSAVRYCSLRGSEAESSEVLDKGHQGLSGSTGEGNQGSATPHQATPKTKELDLGEDR